MRLLVQRRLKSGDRNKWRTVFFCIPEDSASVTSIVSQIHSIDPQVEWRIATETGTVLATF